MWKFLLLLALSRTTLGLDVNETSGSLRAQKPIMTNLQSEIDSIDKDRLGPAVLQNTNILQSLRQASLMLDGKSDLHTEMATIQSDLSRIKSDIIANQIPSLQTGLESVKTALLNQATQSRSTLQSDMAAEWKTIETKYFVPFLDLIRKQAIAVIANISVPIAEIENFDNQTTLGLNQTVYDADLKLNTSVSTLLASLQVVESQVQYMNDEIVRLLNTRIPTKENATMDSVFAEIESDYKSLVNSASTSSGESQTALDALVNSTSTSLYTSLNRTRDTLTALIKDPSAYTTNIASLQSLVEQNSDIAYHASVLRTMIQDKVKSLTERKQLVINSLVTPVVSGLGNKTAALQSNFNNISSNVASQITAARDAGYRNLDAQSAAQQQSFSTAVNSTYYQNIAAVEKKLGEIEPFAQTRLSVANSTLEDLLLRAGPRITAMQKAIAEVADEANQAKTQAQAGIDSIKKSVYTGIESRYVDFGIKNKGQLDNLNTSVSTSYDTFKRSVDDFVATIHTKESMLQSALSAASTELVNLRQDQQTAFMRGLKPVPDVTKDNEVIKAEDGRVTLISQLETDTEEFANNLDLFKTEFSKKMDSVNSALNHIDQSKFDQQTRDHLLQLVKDYAEQAVKNIATELPKLTSGDDSLNKEINAIIDSTKKSIVAFETELANTKWTPSVEIASIESVAKDLRDASKSSLSETQLGIEDIRSEFAQNFHNDDEKISNDISSLLAAQQARDLGDDLHARLDSGNGVAKMNEVLVNTGSAMGSFSDDASTFRMKTREAKDLIDSMDSTLNREKSSIDFRYPSVARQANQDINQIATALAGVIASGSKMFTDDSKLKNFKESQNQLIDAKINATRASIMEKLKDEFLVTQGAIQEYLDHVNSSVVALDSTEIDAEKRVASSAMQLKELTNDLELTFQDGLEAAKSQRLKDIRMHDVLDRAANETTEAMKRLERSKMDAENELKSNLSKIRAESGKNVSQFNDWFNGEVHKLQKLDDSTRKSVSDSVESVMHEGEYGMKSMESSFGSNITDLISTLEKTELLPLLKLYGELKTKVRNRVEIDHSVAQRIISAMNATNHRLQFHNASHGQVLHERLRGVEAEIGNQLPKLLREEVRARQEDIKEQARELEQKVTKHEPHVLDPKKELDRFFSVPMMADMIREARAQLKSNVAMVKPVKDVTDEIKEIREQLNRLRDSHKRFIRDQEMKVRKSLRSRQKGRSKQ